MRRVENGDRRPIDILLVDDSPGDVRLVSEGLRETGAHHVLHVADDGIEALEFLFRNGAHRDAPRPDLILLDLNLPRLSGSDVLREIKSTPETASIPVIVLSTSSADADIDTCYANQASCYITKPSGIDEYFDMVSKIKTFWMETVRLPHDRQNPVA